MPDELVTVGSYEFVSEAEVAQLQLQSEGITAFLRDAQILNMDWLLGNAIGYVKLQVPREQEESARQILSALPATAESGEAEGHTCQSCELALPAASAQCPACGWTADDDPNNRRLQAITEKSKDDEIGNSMLGSFRSMKRPVFLLYLAPIILFLLLAIGALFEGLFKLVTR